MENNILHFRRYNIFISSTFRDMDFERDLIKFHVIPLLNERFKSRFVEIQAIDLRMGINTEKMAEEDAANKILQVCANCIDETRPFFIGLIGSRYGWVPPVERWREFISRLSEEDQEMMKDTLGKSVTEMEITYGALSEKSLRESHTLFFMRDHESYNGIPEDILEEFCDTDPENILKLNSLKKKIKTLIEELGGSDDRIIPYHLNWNREIDDFDETDNDFVEKVTESLATQIEGELEAKAELSWWEEEKIIAERNLEKCLSGIAVNLPYYDEPAEQVLYSGDIGSGRSTLLAWQWNRMRKETNDICLAVCVGKTPYSSAMYYTLARWCEELAHEIGEDPRGDKLIQEDEEFVRLCDEFYYLVDQAKEKGRRVSVFIDDADRFKYTNPLDLYLGWIDYRINAVITCEDLESIKVMTLNHHLEAVILEKLEGKCLEDVIDAIGNRFHLEMPGAFRKDALKRGHYPISITVLFRILSIQNGLTFDDIRNNGKGFNEVFVELFKPIFDTWFMDEEAEYIIATELASHVCNTIGIDDEWYQMMLGYLSKSPCGLRTKDLEALAEDDWDALKWAQVTYHLSDFIEVDSNHLWRTSFGFFGYDTNTPEEDLEEYAMTLPDGDWIKDRLLKKPMLEFKKRVMELDRKALDRVWDNHMRPDMGMIDRIQLKKLFNNLLQKGADFESLNVKDSSGLNKNPFCHITEESIRLRNKGLIIEEIAMLKEAFKIIRPDLESIHLNDECLLENLTLQFFNLYGAVPHWSVTRNSAET